MDKFSINDWTTLQTRKELSYIRRSIEHKSIDYAIIADLFIVLFSFVLDHTLWTVIDEKTGAVEQVAPSWYWGVTAVLMVLVPAIIIIYNFLKMKRYQADVKMVMPVDYLVNLFDNEVCYNVMTADSMLDHIKNAGYLIGEDIRKFYFIEALYYANKATTHLFYFKNQRQKAIQTKNSFGGISYIRFQNVCHIISRIYSELVRLASENNDYTVSLEESEGFIYNFNELVYSIGNEIKELEKIKDLTITR